MPVAGELPLTAPLITQVSFVTLQLTLVLGLATLIVVAQLLCPLIVIVVLAGQVMLADVLSVTVTVNAQVVVPPLVLDAV